MEFYDFEASEKSISAREWCSRKSRRVGSAAFWLRRFPLVTWLRGYSWTFAFYDIVAGVTVGLLVLPQCLAAAAVAGLPPQYGLYSSIVGYFLYSALGTCRVINFGPTLLVSMLLRPYTDEFGPEAVVLVTFLSGTIIALMALLQLAPVVEFISYPVLIGFMSSGVINIMLSQAVAMVGIKGGSVNVIESIQNIVNGIDQFKLWDTLLGLSCITILLLIWKLGDMSEKSCKNGRQATAWNTFLKYFALCRNAIVLVLSMAFVSIMISINGESPVSTPEEIDEGFPPLRLPTFQLTQGNVTLTFGQTLSELSSALFVVPLIVLLEFISVAKAFSDGKTIDTTQEVLTLGLTNVLGSFVQSIPVTGSFTRSAVNDASGVKTPISGVYTGAMVVAVLGLLAHWLAYIPSATLSAVIISALVFLFRIPQATKDCINSSKKDLIPLYVTFLVGLFVNLTFAIVCGVLVDFIFLIYPSARPCIIIKTTKLADIGEALLVVPDKSLSYSNVEYFKERVQLSAALVNMDLIAIDGSFIHKIDTTTIKSLKVVVRDFQSRGMKVLFLNWRPGIKNRFVKFDCMHFDLFIPSSVEYEPSEKCTSSLNIY